MVGTARLQTGRAYARGLLVMASQARQGSRWERVEASRRVREAQGKEVTSAHARVTRPVRGAARARIEATAAATAPRTRVTSAHARVTRPVRGA